MYLQEKMVQEDGQRLKRLNGQYRYYTVSRTDLRVISLLQIWGLILLGTVTFSTFYRNFGQICYSLFRGFYFIFEHILSKMSGIFSKCQCQTNLSKKAHLLAEPQAC